MKSTKYIILIFLMQCITKLSTAQGKPLDKYVIIIYEDIFKKSQHNFKNYYWIIPEDSISLNNRVACPLYISGYSTNNLTDCCNGKAIDPYVVEPNSNFIFDNEYEKSLDNLLAIISKDKIKIQKITIRWAIGQIETITVFAVPVSGSFCSSQFRQLGEQRTGYKGKVFLPRSSFRLNKDFWSTPLAKSLLTKDWSRLQYNIIPFN